MEGEYSWCAGAMVSGYYIRTRKTINLVDYDLGDRVIEGLLKGEG